MNFNVVFTFLLLNIASCNFQKSGEVEHLEDAGRESRYDQKLANRLFVIHESDQNIRIQLMDCINKYHPDKQTLFVRKCGLLIRLIKVKQILDTKGWLGAETVGETGTSTIFLVIQHADPKTMEHYLPMLRDAVKNKKANSKDLAKMEDRVLVRQGKKQLYGTQFRRDSVTKKYVLDPLGDPDNVDKRRAKMGLGKLSDYLLEWGIT